MSPRVFEARVRQELMRQQLLAPFTESAFVSNAVAERVMRLSDEKREVSLVRIQPEQFLGQMKPDDEAIKAYYEAHKAEFQLPEQVRVEYAILSLDELAKQSQVSTDEAIAYFEAHFDEFGQPEERRASHILISAPSSATDSDRAAARVRAEQLLAELKQNPERFTELAREHSQDPGSAPAGGDLGFFGRNMMTKSFEDAVFKMKQGEISGLVETEHGFHIIKLDEIKSGKKVDFADVKSQVEREVKKEKATKLFGEMADNFSNIVYEQSDSLKPAAENFGLAIRQSGWVGRSGGEPPYFTNERLLMAIFSDDAIKDKRNTEAIEVSPNTLISARVLDYKPAITPSLTELKDKIADRVAREEASKAALSEGKEKLAELQKGKGKDEVVKWGPSQQVSRKEPQGLDNQTVQAIFKADATNLPSYYGLPNSQGGFTLIRVGRVIEAAQLDPGEKKAFAGQLQQLLAQEELSSYLEGIKKRYDVSVKNENIEK
jgi:peptidyl-prolyl cis-trans isomerase D